MLTGYAYDDVIEPGESDELLQIFVLDKAKYEKIWKDKSFEMEMAHLQNAEAKELFEDGFIQAEVTTLKEESPPYPGGLFAQLHFFTRCSLNAFNTTDTELKAMAAPATHGARSPAAAMGMPIVL